MIDVRGGYTVRFMLRQGNAVRMLATKNGELRVFSSADSALRQLRAVALSLGNVVGRSSTYQPAALRPGRDDRRQAIRQANDYGRWLKAETHATFARVACATFGNSLDGRQPHARVQGTGRWPDTVVPRSWPLIV